jgi:hypothetical protein
MTEESKNSLGSPCMVEVQGTPLETQQIVCAIAKRFAPADLLLMRDDVLEQDLQQLPALAE